RLLDAYRNYLRLLARTQMSQGLHACLEPSDLVQEALLEADRDFSSFSGGTEKELLAWLRRILVRNLLDAARHHQAQARDRQRQPFEDIAERLGRKSGAVRMLWVRALERLSQEMGVTP